MSYAARTDVEQVFGPINVAKWADLDNDEDAAKIAARIVTALAWADAEIDDRLRGGVYSLPLQGTTGSLPATIVDLAANLAGVWLYEARGVQDFAEDTGIPFHRLSYSRKRCESALTSIRNGSRLIDCLRAWPDAATAPFVVKEKPQ
jgi:phage gp36-like protein